MVSLLVHFPFYVSVPILKVCFAAVLYFSFRGIMPEARPEQFEVPVARCWGNRFWPVYSTHRWRRILRSTHSVEQVSITIAQYFLLKVYPKLTFLFCL